MAIDYTTMPLPEQYPLAIAIEPLAATLATASTDWQTAADQLSAAAASLRGQSQDVHRYWQDSAGGTFADRTGRSAGEVGQWSDNIVSSRVPALLNELAALIPPTVQTVREAYQQYLRLVAIHTNGISVVDQIRALQKKSGAAMNQLAEKFETAGRALGQVAGGSPQWSGPRGAGGGGAAGGGAAGGGPAAGGGQTASAPAGGGSGPSAASPASGDQASATAGATGPSGATQPDRAGDPSLQGVGSLAPSPPLPSPQTPLPPSAQPIPTAPPGGGGPPFIPPVGLAGGGAGGVRHGSVGGLGARANLGPKSIPQAAVPVLTDAVAKTNGSTPVSPATPAPSRPGGTSMFGVPPMAPMMGGIGAGGSAGLPGPGTAQRPVSGRGAKPTSTPGVPPALQGKAARVDRSAFSQLPRPARREPVAENTVPLLDDEMWQVDQAPAEIRGERPEPARRPAY
jgi:hypothetical protein